MMPVADSDKAAMQGLRSAANDRPIGQNRDVVPLRVAILTNMLLQHDVRAFEALRPLVKQLRVFISAITEPDRQQQVQWGKLDIVVQRSLRWSRPFKNKHGYRDLIHLQIPYDTLAQLRTYKPDVIVSNQFGGRTLLAVLFCMLRPKTKLIVWATLSQRTEAVRGRLRMLVRKVILRRADACFVHGRDGEEYLRKLGFQGRVFRTPYVSDPAQYSGTPIGADDDVLQVLFTGQLIERKGVYLFTSALCDWCREHPERRVRLTIGGEGPERERLSQLPLPPNLQVEYLGHLDADQCVVAYRKASLYVFPTLGDEWGMVVNEALCMGLPVLASKHGQAALELVEDGYNGWLFDPQDPADLARGLNRALTAEPATLMQMSQNALKSVANVTPERTAEVRAEAIRIVGQGVASYSE